MSVIHVDSVGWRGKYLAVTKLKVMTAGASILRSGGALTDTATDVHVEESLDTLRVYEGGKSRAPSKAFMSVSGNR